MTDASGMPMSPHSSTPRSGSRPMSGKGRPRSAKYPKGEIDDRHLYSVRNTLWKRRELLDILVWIFWNENPAIQCVWSATLFGMQHFLCFLFQLDQHTLHEYKIARQAIDSGRGPSPYTGPGGTYPVPTPPRSARTPSYRGNKKRATTMPIEGPPKVSSSKKKTFN